MNKMKMFDNNKQNYDLKGGEKMQKQYTGIRIENEMLEKIDQIAEKNGRTRSNLIRFIIQKYVESHDM